ncbi:MAG: DNA-protecting protein DprA [Thermomicrobiales bacterium]|nr:DNA-protecting protein DprA [Thermomicrobiales bacterium]
MGQTRLIGPVRLRRLVERFGSAEAVWRAPESALRAVLDGAALASLLRTRAALDLEREMARIHQVGVAVLTLVDPRYPRLLREIPAPPPVLYLRGELAPEDETAVGIVGTRRATSYGREVAARLGGELAAAGVTVISGMARGIDAAAHHAALEAGGRTIAVLGCGPDVIYPPEHRALAARIIDRGALLSEYPPGRKPDATNFPARNRIISGLSLGIAIVEAPERSGALITADFAADHGREVFVVPGSVLSANSEGGLRLLRDGARLIRSAADVLEDLQLGTMGAIAVQQTLPLGEEERRVLAALSREPQHIDEIAGVADLPIAEVSARLTMLELQGLVRNAGALHYARA